MMILRGKQTSPEKFAMSRIRLEKSPSFHSLQIWFFFLGGEGGGAWAPCCWVDDPIKLIIGHCLRVEVSVDWLLFLVLKINEQ